jgi:hypothetical protein
MPRLPASLAAALILGCALRAAALDGTWASSGSDREVIVFLAGDEYCRCAFRVEGGRETTVLERGLCAVNGSTIVFSRRKAADTDRAQGWKEDPGVRSVPFRAGDGLLEVDGIRFRPFPDALRAVDSPERLYPFFELALAVVEAKVPGWGAMGMKAGAYAGEVSGKTDLSISIALIGPTVTRFRFTDYSDFHGMTLNGEMEIDVNLDWGRLTGGMKGTLEMKGAVDGSICYDRVTVAGGEIADGVYGIRLREAATELPHRSTRRSRFRDFRFFP